MGCTSSTTNMPETQSSTTDNADLTREDSGEPIKKNDIIYSDNEESEQTQVLPECKITNNQQIASDGNSKSTGNINIQYKDVEAITPTRNHGDTDIESSLNDNLVLSLKLVMENVLSENTDEHEQIDNETETRDVELDRQIEEITESNVTEDVEHELTEDEAKESPSPAQSEDSRATRWEALADIAAELPPSLAVDPLTGQIYSLTK